MVLRDIHLFLPLLLNGARQAMDIRTHTRAVLGPSGWNHSATTGYVQSLGRANGEL